MAFYTCRCHMAASSAVVASAPNVLLTLSVWARAAEHTILQQCALANTHAQRPPTTMQKRKTPLCNRQAYDPGKAPSLQAARAAHQ